MEQKEGVGEKEREMLSSGCLKQYGSMFPSALLQLFKADILNVQIMQNPSG